MRGKLTLLVGVCASAIAFAQPAPESTPTELPGAEAFVYRAGPTPVRLFVVKPAGWKAGDQKSWEQQLKARGQYGQNEYTRVN